MIVDAQPTTRALLRVKLTCAYYETEQAESAEEALRLARVFRPNVVIFGDSLPGNDPARFVTRLRGVLPGEQIRCVFLQAKSCAQARHSAIAAGVEDVMSLPLDHEYLLARLRCIFRAIDNDRDSRLREDADRALGLAEAALPYRTGGRLTLIHPDPTALPSALVGALERVWRGRFVRKTPEDILRRDSDGAATDLYLLFGAPRHEARTLALLSELRAHGRTRHAAILYGAAPGQTAEAARALDLGADDAVLWDCCPEELVAWCERLITRRRAAEAHRLRMQTGLQAALVDPLTGLWNRRYALPNLDQMVATAAATGDSCCVMIADLDHFKRVNDRHGHMTGDAVLRSVAKRLQSQLRGVDVIARLGGEEFLILLPDADRDYAEATARRLMAALAGRPVTLAPGDTDIAVSVSIGIAMGPGQPTDAPSGSQLLAEADRALYRAKAEGRSRWHFATPAANKDGARFMISADARRSLQRRFWPASLTSKRSA
ncbi:response regulator receiver modulated diguanylate cyclase [Roseivivax lentus]|uniref:diguanylate cyclase n=2 Tax=Roseivivax lentus TaxID=633194 RepID=A0A1N7PNY5_9RHOB|nr:response regulator receiver modulated diguanylate cyclase [Roseivivax lentus]